MKLIDNPHFYCPNKDTYPPFKNGRYLEEYFFQMMTEHTYDLPRKYIPALWTNFQIEDWFQSRKSEMQRALDQWVLENPNPNGYFTIVQHDDGPQLSLPENTVVYGACSGDIPIPLIYEDTNLTLVNKPKKTFGEKSVLCSFVGNITANSVAPNVRYEIFCKFHDNPRFRLINSGGWTASVNAQNQDIFIETTIHSKFAFAPRGYGRGSFRFFECFQLGTIPIYVWNDICWLPFQDKIDYQKLCIVSHVSELENLEQKLLEIDEKRYNSMLEYYQSIRHLFELEGMSNWILLSVA